MRRMISRVVVLAVLAAGPGLAAGAGAVRDDAPRYVYVETQPAVQSKVSPPHEPTRGGPIEAVAELVLHGEEHAGRVT